MMTNITIKDSSSEPAFKLRCEHQYPPTWNRVGDVGLDLYAAEEYHFSYLGNLAIAHDIAKIRTGVFVENIPDGFWLQLETPSGLAVKGMVVTGGVIDTNYRGEVGVILLMLSDRVREYTEQGAVIQIDINQGDKIAQLVIRQAFYPSNFQINGQPVTPQTDEPRGEKGGLWG